MAPGNYVYFAYAFAFGQLCIDARAVPYPSSVSPMFPFKISPHFCSLSVAAPASSICPSAALLQVTPVHDVKVPRLLLCGATLSHTLNRNANMSWYPATMSKVLMGW